MVEAMTLEVQVSMYRWDSLIDAWDDVTTCSESMRSSYGDLISDCCDVMTAADVMSACDSSSSRSACSLSQFSCHSDSITNSSLLKSYRGRVALSSTVRQLINLLNRRYCEHSISFD